MASTLSQLSDALADAVESAASAVIRVEGRRRLAASGIVWREDGIIITANHVAKRDSGMRVGLPGGELLEANLVGRDPSTDLAVLRIERTGLPTLELDDEPRVGQLVLALGRPGKSIQATLGIVSARSKESWRTAMGGQIDGYLQTDVVMYPGFSGGPLISANGHLLGLNSSALVRGVSVAVPTSTLNSVVETLLAHGSVRRAFLGVSTQPARLPGNAVETLAQETGLLVVAVEPDSPAEEAGLVLGDTIVSLDGEAVRQHDDLLALLSADRINRKVPMGILRAGQVQSVNVTPGTR